MIGAIYVVFELFRGYANPRFSVLLTCLAIPSVLTIINRFDYGDAAFLAGALTIGFALFMPQSVSGYNMFGAVSGLGILQLLLVLAMISAWYFNASYSVLLALSLFNVIPVSLVFTSIYNWSSIVGPFVSLCGATLALLASLLGDGVSIENDTSAVAARLVLSIFKQIEIQAETINLKLYRLSRRFSRR